MTKKSFVLVVITLVLNLLSSVSWADHGRDFLLVQTARLGEAGNVFGIARQDYTREENGNALAFEPLLSWNAYDWLSLEINGDAEKVQGESLNYEATVPGLRLRFTPEGQALVLGVAARYDIVAKKDGSDTLKLSGLGTHQTNNWLFGVNINYEKSEGARREWGYAVGIKRELRHHLSLGLEVAGGFEGEKSSEVVAGIFYELAYRLQINVGIGTGFNNDVNQTIKTALIWRFK